MGNSISRKLNDNESVMLANETGFSIQQVQILYSRFRKLDRTECGYLTKIDFLMIPELYVNPIGCRIVDVFFQNEIEMDFRQFLSTLSIFNTISNVNSKNDDELQNYLRSRFLFDLYDIDNKGVVKFEDIFTMFSLIYGESILIEKIRTISAELLDRADPNGMGEISFETFLKVFPKCYKLLK